jgi:tetratricopeptide (TPR) repeat protein
MANAVIAYDQHRPQESQQYLDQILSQPRPFPDAAVLRAQIALEEGNVPFARRLLEQEIMLVPDHAGLHEVHAATLFVDRRLDEARAELTRAAALGAPRWRIAYHLGMIEEMSGRPAEAVRLYMEALQGNPAFAAADSRLRGLRAAPPTAP